VLYPLPELLVCCLVGVLCGAEGWVEVEEYGEAKLDFLRRFVPFDHGIASHDTFSDVFNALDPEGFKAAFIAWTATLQENVREIVAIDGKTLRRSFDRGQGQGPIHMISAWAAGSARGRRQEERDHRHPRAACAVEPQGRHRHHRRHRLSEEDRRRHSPEGRRLPPGAQGEPPTLYRDVADFLVEQRAVGFQDCAAASWAEHHTSDADHGRIETRRHWITSDIGWLHERHPAWPDLTSIAMIEAVREEPGKPASRQTRFYITSIAPDAAEFARAARQHWGIENGLHWVLDVVYREDECRIRKRNGPANFATIRHITLNLLQRTKTAKNKERSRQTRPRCPRSSFSPIRPDGSLMPSSDSPAVYAAIWRSSASAALSASCCLDKEAQPPNYILQLEDS
jgi:predicted transposase YbfD/YdcC